MAAVYEVELRLDGELIGDVRRLAEGLTWAKRRTRSGVDSISFSVNDQLFANWLVGRTQRPIDEVLRPYALDCRILRNKEPMVGGYLATKPAYTPNGTSATLALQFDGYLNLLEGIYEPPTKTQHGRLSDALVSLITEAEQRATNAGKGFGITAGNIEQLAQVQYSWDNYKTLKSFITDRCDNVSGAGPFDLVFDVNRSYDIISDANFGKFRDYQIRYPSRQSGVSALSISAGEVNGFASKIIAVGEGNTSSEEEDQTAIISEAMNSEAVLEYGYVEQAIELSSISVQATLDNKAQTELTKASNPNWAPELTLSGIQIAPSPATGKNIWIGDRVMIKNDEDLLGATNGLFRVMSIEVAVSATNAETITPTLERIEEVE